MGWGISKLIFLKSIFYFYLFTLLHRNGFHLLSIPFLYASLLAALVALVSHPRINLPMLLGKKGNGTFPVWSLVMFSPYLLFARLFSAIRRLASGEEPYSQVIEGLYVGGWPSSPDRMPPGNPAVIDCTCELPRNPDFMKNSYLCVPTWDTRAPDPGDIESAVKWASRKRAQGVPIFIHCAYGHGRSVAVMCALLVALGVVDDWKNAEKLIQQRRPCIRMNSLHRMALDEWAKHRLSPSLSSSSHPPKSEAFKQKTFPSIKLISCIVNQRSTWLNYLWRNPLVVCAEECRRRNHFLSSFTWHAVALGRAGRSPFHTSRKEKIVFVTEIHCTWFTWNHILFIP